MGILFYVFVVDVFNELSDEMGEECVWMILIYDKFGGFFFEGFSEFYGYYGWWFVYFFVSEVVKLRIDIGEIVVEFLENIERGKVYVNKFLRE